MIEMRKGRESDSEKEKDRGGTQEDLKEIRRLLFLGEIQKVDSLLVEKFSNKTNQSNLNFEFIL